RRRAVVDDTDLVYKVRQALRDQLRVPEVFAQLRTSDLPKADAMAIADVAVAIQSSAAASFLLAHLEKISEPGETMTRYLRHAVRFLPENDLDKLAGLTRSKFGGDVDLQLA